MAFQIRQKVALQYYSLTCMCPLLPTLSLVSSSITNAIIQELAWGGGDLLVFLFRNMV